MCLLTSKPKISSAPSDVFTTGNQRPTNVSVLLFGSVDPFSLFFITITKEALDYIFFSSRDPKVLHLTRPINPTLNSS